MPMPSRLKIGGFWFPVRCDPADKDFLDSHQAVGRTSTFPRQVLIDASVDLPRRQETLIHEVLHLASGNSGLRETWAKKEEEYVNRLALSLHQILTDNPEILTFLGERDAIEEG